MFKIKEGNIFEGRHTALVNPVNLKGIPGALAAVFAEKFPDLEEAFQDYLTQYDFTFGDVVCVESKKFNKPKYIFYIPTTIEPGAESDIRVVTQGLQNLANELETKSISSIGIPALGCGVGRLNFEEVSAIAENILKDSKTMCYMYKPL